MFYWSPGNQILDLEKYVSPIDDNEIKELHEQDAETIDDEDAQEILADIRKKTHMSLTVAETEMKRIMTLMIMKISQVRNRLKYTKIKIINKMNRTRTSKRRSLMNYYTLLIVMMSKLQTMVMFKEQKVKIKARTVAKMSYKKKK